MSGSLLRAGMTIGCGDTHRPLCHLPPCGGLRTGRRQNRSSGAILGEKAMRAMPEWQRVGGTGAGECALDHEPSPNVSGPSTSTPVPSLQGGGRPDCKPLCPLHNQMLIPASPHHRRMSPINPTRREARRTFVGRLPGEGRRSLQALGPSARRLTLGRQDRPPPDARDNARNPGTRRRRPSH